MVIKINNNGCRYDDLVKSKTKHKNEFYENMPNSNKSKVIYIISIIIFCSILIFGIFDTIFSFCFKIKKPIISILLCLILSSFITYFIYYILHIIKN